MSTHSIIDSVNSSYCRLCSW